MGRQSVSVRLFLFLELSKSQSSSFMVRAFSYFILAFSLLSLLLCWAHLLTRCPQSGCNASSWAWSRGRGTTGSPHTWQHRTESKREHGARCSLPRHLGVCGPSQAKVENFQITVFIYSQVGGFQISVTKYKEINTEQRPRQNVCTCVWCQQSEYILTLSLFDKQWIWLGHLWAFEFWLYCWDLSPSEGSLNT